MAQPAGTPSSRVWFEDGKADTTLFRVYRGILTAHSPIFRDMRATPRPENQKQFDGFPIFEVHHPPESLEALLVAFHGSSQWTINDIGDLVALFSLGKKYEIDHIRNYARIGLAHHVSFLPQKVAYAEEPTALHAFRFRRLRCRFSRSGF
ncbi:hypothetical protein C8R44DRAFT_326045 [Mycena epipterygia]|nr:hypothetical protein C8R44DRAFT_326045 [Mycena epipterygia]